jgi:hypothetical protein
MPRWLTTCGGGCSQITQFDDRSLEPGAYVPCARTWDVACRAVPHPKLSHITCATCAAGFDAVFQQRLLRLNTPALADANKEGLRVMDHRLRPLNCAPVRAGCADWLPGACILSGLVACIRRLAWVGRAVCGGGAHGALLQRLFDDDRGSGRCSRGRRWTLPQPYRGAMLTRAACLRRRERCWWWTHRRALARWGANCSPPSQPVVVRGHCTNCG